MAFTIPIHPLESTYLPRTPCTVVHDWVGHPPLATGDEYRSRWGQTADIALISCTLAGVVITLGSVIWYLARFLRRQAARMRVGKPEANVSIHDSTVIFL
jgi:hypothetical protein